MRQHGVEVMPVVLLCAQLHLRGMKSKIVRWPVA